MVIDKLRGGEDLTYQNVGDIANSLVLLGFSSKQWSTLSTFDKLNGTMSFIEGVYNLANRKITQEEKEKYGKDLQEVLDWYSKIENAQ